MNQGWTQKKMYHCSTEFQFSGSKLPNAPLKALRDVTQSFGLRSMIICLKVKNQYLKILEYFLRSIKKRICKTEKFKFFKVYSFMHSVRGRGSFSSNSSISEVWHQPVTQPSAYLYCWIHCFSSFSWKYPIDSRRGSGQACCLANQAQ